MRKLALLFLFIIGYSTIYAQSVVSGKVVDAKTGTPLAGVSIKVKSSKAGTSTDNEGAFKIQAKPTDILEISNIGYTSQSLPIKGQNFLTIALQPSSLELQEIVFVGSRSAGRAKTETVVPVDVIKVNQIDLPTAKMDLTSILNVAAPSFNYNKQSGADGADHVDLGTLRGLGPDQTLVLINGKRRHQTAFVALFGTRGRGNSGVDLNAFPEGSVDRIEILRDGASAQYGSDAMAGVINIILKKDVNHWAINTGYSAYSDHHFNALNSVDPTQYYTGHQLDGGTFSFSANNGVALGKKGGFINFTLDFLTQGKTYRQVPDTNVTTNPKALPVNSSRRAFGDGSITTAGAMFNMELPLGTAGKSTFYSFGGYNYKASDAFAYTRNGSDPTRFPIDGSGNIIFDPAIMRKAGDGTIFYNPHIQTHITDYSLALGIRGNAGKDWNWDLSNTIGRNNFHFYGDKTFNASMGAASPNHFDDGGFNFLQNTVNLDFSKSFKSVAQGLNLGLGAEYRFERYAIYAGEEASWKRYPDTSAQRRGSQGFPGFSPGGPSNPSDVLNANRSNFGAYIDAELNLTKEWLLDGAVRIENYSDFGFVNIYKLATRYKLASNFNLRGSVSSGFRAPSLQQINFSNTVTTFLGNYLVESRIARNGDPITLAAGIPKLKEETSVNGSIGFSWKPMPGLLFTVDGYLVKVHNRIVLSGLFGSVDSTLPPKLTSQLQAIGVQSAQFFDNAVSTTNKGIDIVVDYSKKLGDRQNLKILLAGNIQEMKVDKVNVPPLLNDSYLHQKTFFSDREEAFLLASAPKNKFSLNIEYDVHKFGIGTHLTYFGKIKLLGFGWTGPGVPGSGVPGDPNISGSFTGIDPYVQTEDGKGVLPEIFNYNAKITTDVYASYKFSGKVSLFIGADNLFNVHPDLGAVPNGRFSPANGTQAFDNESGGAWDSVQMGFNGRRLFTKLAFNF